MDATEIVKTNSQLR